MENVPRPGVPNRAIRDGSRRKRRSGSSGVSGGLFYALLVSGMVFENSAACVYVETSAVGFGLPARNKTRPLPSGGDTLSTSSKRSLPLRRQTNFTESLILAQDERWRRA